LLVAPNTLCSNSNGSRHRSGEYDRREVVFVESQIVVDGLTHVFKPPRGREVVALNGVTLDIRHREFVAVLGPSGCGKSTLLYMLGGFIPVEQGRILVDGKPVSGPGPDRGIVFQHFALFPWKTVRQNVLYGLECAGLSRAEREDCARDFINLVGLEGFEDSYPSQLSGGMKQRAAIARTLAINPNILLMDEPFGALDAQTRSLMQSELLRIWEHSPKTVIFVTHDVQEAVYLANRVIVMSARPGRVKATIDIEVDKTQPGVFKDKYFIEKVDEIWDLVRAEAILAQGIRTQ
jgi:NitT/TauT family transport system ATP-binding protein